jgi:hypothetical protein
MDARGLTARQVVHEAAPTMSDTRTACVHHCKNDDLLAVTHDASGGNLAGTTCIEGWLPCADLSLSVN